MLRHRVRLLAAVVSVIGVLGGWLLLAPPQLGGGTSYVTTHGVSMEPSFHAGDLVLVRETDEYQVGDVTAYRSPLLHTIVLHRITAVRDGHYEFKGDNNAWYDPEHPGPDQLVGRLWLHVPGGGTALGAVAQPVPIAAIFAALVLLGGGETVRRRRRSRVGRRVKTRLVSPPREAVAESASGPRKKNARLPDVAHLTIAQQVAAALAIAGLALSGLAFTTATTRPTTRTASATAQTDFAYSATAKAGPVYPNGRVRTGDPVFVRLVSALNLVVTRSVLGAAAMRGTSSLTAKLVSQTGWQRKIVLAPAKAFTGATVRREGRLDLVALASLARQVEAATGSSDGGYDVVLTLDIKYTAEVSGRAVARDDQPSVTFKLGPTQLAPPSDSAAPAPAGAPSGGTAAPSALSSADAVSVKWTDRAGNTTSLGPLAIPVLILRILALLLVIAAIGLAVLGRTRGPADPHHPHAINRRHAAKIITVTALPDRGERSIADVVDFAALAQLAARYELPILYHAAEVPGNAALITHTYLVDDSTLYRHEQCRVVVL